MTATEIAAHLAANVATVTLVVGTNLFTYRLPDSPDVCVAVIPYGGIGEHDMGRSTGLRHEYTRFQVNVRHTLEETAWTIANEIGQVLDKLANQTVSGCRWLGVTVTGLPFVTYDAGNDRPIIKASYEGIKEPSTS